MKVLAGRNIYLSTYEDKYLTDFYNWENNLDELYTWHMKNKAITLHEFKNIVEGSERDDYAGYFFIITKKTEELIGYIGYHFIDLENGNFTISTYIKPEYRKGLAHPEAWLIFLDYIFRYFPVRKGTSTILENNKDSLDNALSMGAKVEGIRKLHVYKQGKYLDEYMLAIFREDFYEVFNKFKDYLLAPRD